MKDVKISVLDILDQSKGYDTALFSTFNFDIGFFEKAILSRLFKNSIKRISVFVDAAELAKALRDVQNTLIGQKYIVNPVSMNGAYHPKVILLLGENKARLIIGSGNLKLSGYYINNEIFDCIDYGPDSIDTRDIIVDAFRLFKDSVPFTPELDKKLLEKVAKKVYLRPAASNGTLFFLGNAQQSILSQASAIVTDEVTEIKIAVPYYDNKLKGLDSVNELFPDAVLQLYIQQEKSTFPQNEGRSYIHDIKIFDKVQASGTSHFYHGKVFMFHTETSDYLLYGSANCTQSALVKTPDKEGNFECDLLLKGTVGQFDEFFDSFSVLEKTELISQPMVYESEAKDNYYYKYGVLDKVLVLHIGFIRYFSDAKFRLDGNDLKWAQKENEIIIEIPQEMINDSVIELNVTYQENQETLLCWFIDRQALALFREHEEKTQELFDSPDFAEGDRFKEDIELIMQEMGSCNEYYLQKRDRLAHVFSMISDTEDADYNGSEGNDDYIVNVTLTDDDIVAYKQYRAIERIRNRLTKKYLSGYASIFSATDHDIKEKVELPAEKAAKKKPATTEEKRFSRYVRRAVRNALDEAFIENVSDDHYLGLISILLTVFDKYEGNEGLFKAEYLVRSRRDLIGKLIKKLNPEREDTNQIISRLIGVVIDNHIMLEEIGDYEKRGSLERVNRRILLSLEEKYHLRNDYKGYFTLDKNIPVPVQTVLIKQAQDYIERLYGYKDIAQIEQILRNRCKEPCGIALVGSVAKIIIISEKPADYMRVDTIVLRELANYAANVKPLTKVQIDVKSPKKETGKMIIWVKHIVSLKYSKWDYMIQRADGTKQEYVSKHISY